MSLSSAPGFVQKMWTKHPNYFLGHNRSEWCQWCQVADEALPTRRTQNKETCSMVQANLIIFLFV